MHIKQPEEGSPVDADFHCHPHCLFSLNPEGHPGSSNLHLTVASPNTCSHVYALHIVGSSKEWISWAWNGT